MFESTKDHVACCLHYLRMFALQTPFGLPVKVTVGVSKYDGERLAEEWKVQPIDIVDAHGRAAKQVESSDRLLAVEWLTPKADESDAVRSVVTWGMVPQFSDRGTG